MAKENIYEFKVTRSEKRPVETKRKNKDGEEETVVTNKTVKVPVNIVIQKPTRRLAEDAEVFYSVQLSKSIKLGIVTKAMLVKKYQDSGGALTEEESKELLKNLKKINDLENEYNLLLVTKKEEEAEKIEKIQEEIQIRRRDLLNLEASLQSVYQHTADAKAERDTMVWYAINLTKVIDENGETVDYFKGIDYDEQLDDFYNKFESEDKIEQEIAEKVSKIVGYWIYAQSSDKKDIDKFLKEDEER